MNEAQKQGESFLRDLQKTIMNPIKKTFGGIVNGLVDYVSGQNRAPRGFIDMITKSFTIFLLTTVFRVSIKDRQESRNLKAEDKTLLQKIKKSGETKELSCIENVTKEQARAIAEKLQQKGIPVGIVKMEGYKKISSLNDFSRKTIFDGNQKEEYKIIINKQYEEIADKICKEVNDAEVNKSYKKSNEDIDRYINALGQAEIGKEVMEKLNNTNEENSKSKFPSAAEKEEVRNFIQKTKFKIMPENSAKSYITLNDFIRHQDIFNNIENSSLKLKGNDMVEISYAPDQRNAVVEAIREKEAKENIKIPEVFKVVTGNKNDEKKMNNLNRFNRMITFDSEKDALKFSRRFHDINAEIVPDMQREGKYIAYVEEHEFLDVANRIDTFFDSLNLEKEEEIEENGKEKDNKDKENVEKEEEIEENGKDNKDKENEEKEEENKEIEM